MPGCMIMKQVSFKSLTILRQQQNILIPRKLVLARHETENQQVSTIFKKKQSPMKAPFVIRHYSTQLQYITWCWFYLTDRADTYG